jgi:hypothetical protein
MIRYLFAIGFMAAGLCAAATTRVLAQTPPSEGDLQRIAALENIHKSVIQTVGAQEKTVEVTIRGNILTVVRVNSNLNDSTHGARNNEATAIALIVAKAIADNPKFDDVHTIRVQCLTRRDPAAKGKVLDAIDFRKDVTGKFQLHET